jgi:hypothetical protein
MQARNVWIMLLVTLPASLQGQGAEARFWRWFQSQDSALFAVRRGDEPVCDALAAELQRVHPGLTFEFGPIGGVKREFIISADGIKEAFPAVLALGRAAPVLARWTIIRFRPARPAFGKVTFGGVTLDASVVQFRAEADGERTGLTLAIPGYRDTPDKRWEQAAYLLLDGMLGEYAVETGVGFIEVIDAGKRGAGDWRPLSEVTRAVKPPALPN